MPHPPAHRSDRPALQLIQDNRQLLALAAAGVVLLVIAYSLPGYPVLARFQPEALQSLPDIIAPLVVIALFIERAVEIVSTAWRGAGARRLEVELDEAMSSRDLQSQWRARHALDLYGMQTQRIAFCLAFGIALLISMMGVRAVEMLVSDGLVMEAPRAQQGLFVRVDVVLTALLLAGGAEGIHRVVIAFTTFMETTRDRLDQRAADRRPGGGKAPMLAIDESGAVPADSPIT